MDNQLFDVTTMIPFYEGYESAIMTFCKYFMFTIVWGWVFCQGSRQRLHQQENVRNQERILAKLYTCIFLWNKYKPIFGKYRKQNQKRSTYIRTMLYRCDGQYKGWWINEGQTRSIDMLRIDMPLQFTHLFNRTVDWGCSVAIITAAMLSTSPLIAG